MYDYFTGHIIDGYDFKKGSKISVGKNLKLTIGVDQRFNWFQKKMIKWCFGFTVEDFNKEECNE